MRMKFRKAISRKQKKSKVNSRVRFKFVKTKKPQYEMLWRYAWYDKHGDKKIGLFGKRSKIEKRTVTLFVQDPESREFKACKVRHSLIIRDDPWAACGGVIRTNPPKCVLPVPQSITERRYRKSSGQKPFRGKRSSSNLKI